MKSHANNGNITKNASNAYERHPELVRVFPGSSEMARCMRSVDWPKTPLGPAESWSSSLRMMLRVLLVHPLPMLIWWGPRFCQLYNDALWPALGAKHPRSLGQPASECWPEIWPIIGPLIKKPFDSAEATRADDIFLEINRHGFVAGTHWKIACSPIPDGTTSSRIGGVLGAVSEVTEKLVNAPWNPDPAPTEPAESERQLRAEVELERNRLREVLAQAPAPMALLSGADHKFVFVNTAYEKVVAHDRNQLLGKTARDILPECEGRGFLELLDRVYLTGKPYLASGQKVTIRRCSGEESLYFDFTYFPMRDLAGAVHGILFHGVDVTQWVLAQAQLKARVKERTAKLEETRDRLRTLKHNLMRVQDEERRRLALELHDGAGQLLAALKWKLDPLQQEIGGERPEVGKSAKDSLQLLEELSQELHTVTHLSHPPLLDDGGFRSALGAYIAGLRERSGLMVELEIDPNLERLSEDVEAMLLRIVQESLTNVHRHAGTRTAGVQITCGPEKVTIQVQDKGQGISGFTSLDDPNVKTGLGIRGMRERVRRLKGQFNIESGAGGTTVTAALPIDGQLKSKARSARHVETLNW